MALTANRRQDALLSQQHILLKGISWDSYEHMLNDLVNSPVRLSYFKGQLEMMAPLSEHEIPKGSFGRLIEFMCFELDIPVVSAGSTTFRRRKSRAGLEPDECFYIRNEERIRGLKRWNPKTDPPPDLAIEIDITHRFVAREPIYSALGVPELWRYDGRQLNVRLWNIDGGYLDSITSRAFPFLPIEKFATYVPRLCDENPNAVLRDFQSWIRSLPR